MRGSSSRSTIREGRLHGGIADAHLSYFYYDCPDHFDVAVALRHAQAAYDSSPTQYRWEMALALLRKGDYPEAKRIFVELFEEEPDGWWFELAICLWHLGEKAEARRVYDRSVTSIEGHPPDNPSVINMRQEAAELLGIQP